MKRLPRSYKIRVLKNNKAIVYKYHGSMVGWLEVASYYNEGYAVQAIMDSIEVERENPQDRAAQNRQMVKENLNAEGY